MLISTGAWLPYEYSNLVLTHTQQLRPSRQQTFRWMFPSGEQTSKSACLFAFSGLRMSLAQSSRLRVASEIPSVPAMPKDVYYASRGVSIDIKGARQEGYDDGRDGNDAMKHRGENAARASANLISSCLSIHLSAQPVLVGNSTPQGDWACQYSAVFPTSDGWISRAFTPELWERLRPLPTLHTGSLTAPPPRCLLDRHDIRQRGAMHFVSDSLIQNDWNSDAVTVLTGRTSPGL